MTESLLITACGPSAAESDLDSTRDLPRVAAPPAASGGADRTTIEEEQRFLRQVDALSDRVSISLAGHTLQGRRLDFDDSPATTRLLARSTVLVVPTANPDGRVADTRGNSEGVDIKRDLLALQTREGRAVAKIVRDYKPQVVHDAHEYGGRANVYDRDLIRLWPRNLNVNSRVRAMAVTLSDQYIDPAVRAEGYTTGEYGIFYGPDGTPIAQVAGDENESIMRNMVGLKHAAGQLTESLVNDVAVS